jgi:uncharacterized MnhB-related membrane protein
MKTIIFFVVAYIIGTIIVQFMINSILQEQYLNAIAVLDSSSSSLLQVAIYTVFPISAGSAIEAGILKFLKDNF